jgi:hypothetical protein
VLVGREQQGGNAESGQQRAGHARVFGRNRIDPGEYPERAQRDVGRISDRQGNYIQCPDRKVLFGQSRQSGQVVVSWMARTRTHESLAARVDVVARAAATGSKCRMGGARPGSGVYTDNPRCDGSC